MKNYRILGSLCLLLSAYVWAQKSDTIYTQEFQNISESEIKTDGEGRKYYRDNDLEGTVYILDNGDRLVDLDEVTIVGRVRFNNELDRKYYSFLDKRLQRVYPIFLEALEQYRMLEDELKRIPDKKRKAYAKRRQNELAAQYEKSIRNLTTTEGQIFSKLMFRATGKTVFQIIKDLRGGWAAFWWNLKGNVADVPLKNQYNPHFNRDDQFLESLLQSKWNSGVLKPYPGYQNFTYKKTRD